jgi:hypothetical protein
MKCPECNQEMENLGNVSGMIYTSYPAQWDVVHCCRKCEVKKTERVHGSLPPDMSFLQKYKEVL